MFMIFGPFSFRNELSLVRQALIDLSSFVPFQEYYKAIDSATIPIPKNLLQANAR